jgi:hypothetical protein
MVGWAEHMARMKRRLMMTGVWCENVKARTSLEDIGVGPRITIKQF